MSTKHGKKCAHKVDVIQKSYYTYLHTFWPFFWVSFDHQQKNDDHDGDDLFLRPLLSSCYVCVWPLKNSC